MSIICFISSALGAMALAEGLDGLEAVVVVVVMPLAGLFRLGAVGGTDGLCPNATEAVAAKIVSDLNKVVGLMVAGIVLSSTPMRQASRAKNTRRFYLFSRASRRRAGNVSLFGGSPRTRPRLPCSSRRVLRQRNRWQRQRRAPSARHRRKRRGKRHR